MTEILYIAAIDDEHAAIKSTLDSSDVTIISRREFSTASQGLVIGGDLGTRQYACLYSRKLNRWYYTYYLESASRLLKWNYNKNEYTEYAPRLKLSMCSIFAENDKIIIANAETASVTQIKCMENGFTGLIFDSVIWDHKLFVHAQSFKVLGDGLYFVYNYVAILLGSLQLQPIYETRIADARYLEKKYKLNPQSNMPEFQDKDLHLLKDSLQLFELNKRDNGVYLDDLRIFGGKV